MAFRIGDTVVFSLQCRKCGTQFSRAYTVDSTTAIEILENGLTNGCWWYRCPKLCEGFRYSFHRILNYVVDKQTWKDNRWRLG